VVGAATCFQSSDARSSILEWTMSQQLGARSRASYLTIIAITLVLMGVPMQTASAKENARRSSLERIAVPMTIVGFDPGAMIRTCGWPSVG
jgi:hypothetical protein